MGSRPSSDVPSKTARVEVLRILKDTHGNKFDIEHPASAFRFSVPLFKALLHIFSFLWLSDLLVSFPSAATGKRSSEARYLSLS
ncbi:unnamed protein product [Musa acuminata var. zebrina]